MRTMDFERLLHIFGLKDKRAKIYQAILELGSSTVTPIAKKAGVIRTTTYDILEDLQIRGLVSYQERGGRRYWQVVDPRRFKHILQGQLKEVEKTLPELIALYKPSKEKPVARLYEGAAETGKIYEELLRAPYIYAYGNFDKIEHYYPEFLSYLKKQFKRSIKIRDLGPRTPVTERYKKLYRSPKHQLRFLPDSFHLETDNIIFGDMVAMISYGETVHGLVIESKAIADTQKKLFDQLWEISTP